MKKIKTGNLMIKAEVYTDIINDRLAKIIELKRNRSKHITKEIEELQKKLTIAHQESRIYPDEEHFKQWESLIASVDAAFIRAEYFTRRE